MREIDVDKFGNRLLVDGMKIYIKLRDAGQKKHIGTYSQEHNWIYVFRKTSKRQKMFNMNGYGFNYAMVFNTKAKRIKLSCSDGKFVIPISYIMDNGDLKHFKKSGNELQYFLTLDQIEQFKQVEQLNL